MAVENTEVKVLNVEVKAIELLAKKGPNAGKKFLAFKIFNPKTGYFEELKFNRKVKELPENEGSYILEVDSTQINRIGTTLRKYPLTWISKINSVSELSANEVVSETQDDLPF